MTGKRTRSVIVALLAALFLTAGITAYSTAAKAEETWSVKSGAWEQTTENGATVYTKTSDGLAQLGFGNLDINYGETVTFEFRMNSIAATDGNIGLF